MIILLHFFVIYNYARQKSRSKSHAAQQPGFHNSMCLWYNVSRNRKVMGMNIKSRLARTLERIRNPKYDDTEKAFVQRLRFIRLMLLLPFLAAAVILILFALD